MVSPRSDPRLTIPMPDLEGLTIVATNALMDLRSHVRADLLLEAEVIAGAWHGALRLACAAYTRVDAITTLSSSTLWLHPVDRAHMSRVLTQLVHRLGASSKEGASYLALGLPGADASVPQGMLAIDIGTASQTA